jgi:hypothetical protein
MCPRFADAPATLADVLTLPFEEPPLLGPLETPPAGNVPAADTGAPPPPPASSSSSGS